MTQPFEGLQWVTTSVGELVAKNAIPTPSRSSIALNVIPGDFKLDISKYVLVAEASNKTRYIETTG